MVWRDVSIMVSYQIKRKKEKKGATKKIKKLSPFSLITKIRFSSFLLVF